MPTNHSASQKRIVRKLVDRHGLSQAQITEQLRQDGVEVSQPTISRIYNGRETNRLDLFNGLVRLCERVSQQLNS